MKWRIKVSFVFTLRHSFSCVCTPFKRIALSRIKRTNRCLSFLQPFTKCICTTNTHKVLKLCLTLSLSHTHSSIVQNIRVTSGLWNRKMIRSYESVFVKLDWSSCLFAINENICLLTLEGISILNSKFLQNLLSKE
jgi:hypothetical protein